MCATAGANAVTLSGYTCVATCKALSIGANVLGGDTNGCVNSLRLVVSASEATTCSLKCETGYTASGTPTFSCAKSASANANPSSDFACAINQCTKKSGSRDSYACSRATDKNACKDGAAFDDADRIGDVTKGLGKVTCAPGYGAGPKATAAAKDNNPAVVVCNGKAGSSDTAFAFSGCHRFKCNDIEGKGTDKKNFDESKVRRDFRTSSPYLHSTSQANVSCWLTLFRSALHHRSARRVTRSRLASPSSVKIPPNARARTAAR